MPWTASADPEAFDEAVTWFLLRTPMTHDQWDKLSAAARRKAFMVSGVARADVINDVFRALDRSLAQGKTLEQFKREVGPKLREAWAGTVKNPAWRMETIFRTNSQMAYSAGRWAQMTEPGVAQLRPFAKFDATMDNRVTPQCAALDGTVLETEEFGKHGWVPPLNFNCRSSLRSLRRSQAEKEPKRTAPEGVVVADGFGAAPGAAEWEPDLSKYPPELREEVANRLAQLPDEPMAAPEGARFVQSKEPSGYEAPIRTKVEPTEALPRSYYASPSGTPVGNALSIGGGSATQQVKAGVAAVDAVHGDGSLPEIHVKQVGGKVQSGAFHYDERSGEVRLITVNSGSRCPMWATVHELGHFIDHQGIGGVGAFASEGASKRMKALLEAIDGSSAVTELAGMSGKKTIVQKLPSGRSVRLPVDERHVRYLLLGREKFARAYAQYIAVRGGDKMLLEELSRLKLRGGVLYYPRQWENEDFVTIADAFDVLFEELGWLKKTSS